ncbi:MAG: DUF2723 domain-containing protein [Deltaproteobacteria bacterium]|nr:DUF2723 domain-containing protein [Deltaproteobacteria bacterium]MBW2018476.1 DUF2723 domain-containing protein [Deltaproteobacteria bacterium]MBW2074133.1 DUF2723 domain-containing protein [Deltaproteobacteria bacterium]
MSNKYPLGYASIVFLVPMFIYNLTICPALYPGDSGEFVASAFCLGNPHNAGYPLYCLMGKLFCLLPIGNLAFRLNLMSSFFAALAVLLVYAIVWKLTSEAMAALSTALIFAFSPTLWSQTVCAEVYTLHTFFVALIIAVLFLWYDDQNLKRLLVFAFLVALSFANHIQTVMLAPAVLFVIGISKRTLLLRPRNLLLISLVFLLGLSVYLYLPVRTEAGSSIHWGDPNTLDQFIKQVTASAHRHGYVLTRSWPEYGQRAIDTLGLVFSQYHLLLIFGVIGFFKCLSRTWKLFWLCLFVFDFVYTIFLNIISLEITAFNLPSSVAAAILIGLGMAYVLRNASKHHILKRVHQRYSKSFLIVLPVIPLVFNFYQNDQKQNYVAYEHGINVLRTVNSHGTLLVGSDNTVFPVVYLRLAEGMREDIRLYDHYDIIFKLPFPRKCAPCFVGCWEEFLSEMEKEVIDRADHAYVATLYFKNSSMPEFDYIPHGLSLKKKIASDTKGNPNIWPYYMTESLNRGFYRDYMTRSIIANFYLKLGLDLARKGHLQMATKMMERASEIAYNDQTIHIDLGVFFADAKLFDLAFYELSKASKYAIDKFLLYNTWGYYYMKTDDVSKAIKAFEKAVVAGPKRIQVLNNLGIAYLKANRRDDALRAFQKSLALKPKQFKLINFMKEQGL